MNEVFKIEIRFASRAEILMRVNATLRNKNCVAHVDAALARVDAVRNAQIER